MPKKTTPTQQHPKDKNVSRNWMYMAGIGTEMVVVIFLFTFLGRKLDQFLAAETPWMTILMLFIGLASAFYLVYKQLK